MNKNNATRHGSPATTADPNPDLNTFLDDIRNAGMVVTNEWKELFQTGIKYAWGRHYEGWKLKEDWDYVVVNRIYPLMFQTISKLAGNDPKILTHAWDDTQEGATEYAERWAGHLDYLWKSPYELNMRLKLIKGLLDCAVFGYMVGEPHWDSKPRGGWDDVNKVWVGKAAMRFAHPGTFWADPSAETMENAENCGVLRRVKLEWAQNKWPEFKNEIEREAFTSEESQYFVGESINYKGQKAEKLSKERRNRFGYLTSLILSKSAGGAKGNTSTPDNVGGSEQRYVNVEKIFWRDYSEKSIKIKDVVSKDDLVKQGVITTEAESGFLLDANTQEPFDSKDWPTEKIDEYSEPTFPNGRFVLRIGTIILNPKEEDQVYTESRWPFIVMPYHILPHMWQGGNAIEMAKNSNDVLNMTISSLLQQVRRTADPTKILEMNTLARGRDGKTRTQKDNITGLGKIVVVAKGKIDKIRDWIHPPLDSAVIALAATMKQDVDDSMFMQDVARGAKSPGSGQQTKAEVVRLDVNSQNYVALQGIFLDKFIDDAMTLIAELCQRNYDPGRLMKMLQDGEKQGQQIDQSMLDVRFDVNVEPGSTLPFDEVKKQAEYKLAFDIVANPIPNPMTEDMLRVLNISNRQEILARYQGLQLFQQFIQMGQLLAQASQDPEAGPQVQAVTQQLSGLPGMQQLVQLLMQAGQLAPQMKV